MKVHHAVRHGFDFILLLLIVGLGLSGIIFFRFDVASQIAVAVLMSLLYVFWGVFHHHHDQNLTPGVILEYVGVASLVAFILIVFLLRV